MAIETTRCRPTNPLGAKGAGEAGTVGALPAGVNAIIDALSALGINISTRPARRFGCGAAMEDASACA